MAGVDYCTVLPSWEFDKDPACIVSYLFDSIDGLSEASPTDYTPPTVSPNRCLSLECSSNEMVTADSRTSCSLSITGKPQYRVSILGIDIISQSRSLEVYDACEGYVATSRGSRLPCTDGEGGEEQADMYNCRMKLQETMYGFTVKFPCTSNMRRFNIYSILVILNPETEDDDYVEDGSTFNLDKVKSFVDTDALSPGAQELMRSMEQYQQNKRTALSGLQGMMSQSAPRSFPSAGPVSSGSGLMGLMGLMSMFTNMSPANQSGTADRPNATSATSQSSTRENRTSTHCNTPQNMDTSASQSHSDNVAQGMNGTLMSQSGCNSDLDTLTNTLLTNLPGSHDSRHSSANQNPEEDEDDVYHMLQNICGRVSRMRTTELDESEVREGSEVMEEMGDPTGPCEVKPSSLEGRTELEDEDIHTVGDERLRTGDEHLRTVVMGCVEEMEERLQRHLDSKLAQLEQKLDAKLDTIVDMIQCLSNARSQNPTDNESGENT